MNRKKFLLFLCMLLFCMIWQSQISMAAGGYVNQKYATRDEWVVQSDRYKAYMRIKTATGTKVFYSFDQSDMRIKWMTPKEQDLFLRTGCSSCMVSSILYAYSPVAKYKYMSACKLRFKELKDYTNTGYNVYKKIGQIFDKAKISYKKGRFPNNSKSCAKIIRDDLNKGYQIILIAYNKKRNSSKVDRVWARNAHTMVAAGFTKSGKVILVDSALREWSKGFQRFKVADLDEFSQYLGIGSYNQYYVVMGAKS